VSPGNPFILGSKGQRSRSRLTRHTNSAGDGDWNLHVWYAYVTLFKQVAQLSLTNPRDATHHGKRQHFKTVTW